VQADRSWKTLHIQNFEGKHKQLYAFYKGGYQNVLHLIQILDILQFMLKHNVIIPGDKMHIYLPVCD
jgi:hypothetical protein